MAIDRPGIALTEKDLFKICTVVKHLCDNPETLTTLGISAFIQTLLDDADEDAAQATLGLRQVLTANRTYYVRTGGSDANTGLTDTDGGAFLTIQKALDVVTGTLDLSGATITIQVRDGTFTTPALLSQPWTGGGAITIQGNSATPANVVVSTTSADAFKVTCNLPGAFTIKDLKIVTTTSGNAIQLAGAGTLFFTNLNFGACAGFQLWANAPGAKIKATGDYTISGGAPEHALVGTFGVVWLGDRAGGGAG